MSLGRRFVSTGAADAVCLTESVQVFGADSTYSSNIALYQLDGNDDDTTTNYNGISDANVTYSSTGAYIGQAAIFNGSNAYIDLGTSIASSTRGVSMWVYADDFTERWAFQQGDGQGVENYIRFYNTDDIQVRWGNVTQTFSGYSANTWYHIFAQKDENETPAEVTSLEQLILKVQEEALYDTEENRQRIAKFVAEKDTQQTILDKTLADLKVEEDRAVILEKEFDENDVKLSELEDLKAERLGAFGELFGVVRGTASEMGAQIKESIIEKMR